MTTSHYYPALYKREPIERWEKRRLQPPRIETHRQIVLKVSAAKQSAADTSHGLIDKAFFVVDQKMYTSSFSTHFYINKKTFIIAVLIHLKFSI